MLSSSELLPRASTNSSQPVSTATDQQLSLSQYYKNINHREQTTSTLQRPINPPHSENRNKQTKKQTNTVWGQNAELLNVTQAVYRNTGTIRVYYALKG